MVKKADNQELNDFMSDEELKEINASSSEENVKKETQNKQGQNNNKKRNNNNRRRNNNKQNQNKKSAIPTQRNKEEEVKKEEPKKQPQRDMSNMTLSDFEEYQKEEAKKSQEREEYLKGLEQIGSNERSNLLNNISVDLDNIELISDIDYDIDKENTNFVLNSKATHQVVLPQSSYIAHMESLRNQEILSIAESIDDDYNAMLKRYQLYFHKMNTNSLGITNFQDFAKLTSVYDVSTIEYGLYNISFPGETKFDIQCGSCKSKLKDVKISNDQLMSFKDEEVFEHVTKNVKNITTIEESKEHSLIYSEKRIILADSKIIFEIVTPTVEKHLSVLGSIHTDGLSEEESERFKQNATALMHVKNVYIPDLKSLKEEGKAKYRMLPESNMKDKMKVIENLSIRDGHQLTDAIFDRVNKNAIEYAIKGAKCPKCENDLGKIDIDMSEMLFREALHLV